MSLLPHVGYELDSRFEIIRRIGAGGMGVVYEAYDAQARCRVALKTLREMSGQAVYRLKQEFRSLADVHHPNLVRLGDLFCSRGVWFFTMELVDGRGLLDHVRNGRAQLDEERLRAALRQLAEGIVVLHGSGKVHRDIKPSNVMVTHEGRVVLLDFGLAAAIDRVDAHPSDGGAMGTIRYMAPEQAAGSAPAPAADWYSVGVLLFEALTGVAPFTGHSILEVLAEKQRLPRLDPPDVGAHAPQDLLSLSLELMHPHPAARPSARAIAQRVGLVSAAQDLPSHPSAPPVRDVPFVGRVAERHMLHATLAKAAAGRLHSVILRGVSGTGKTALVGRFLQEVDNALILRGRCYQREAVPYKAFDDVIDALSVQLRRMHDSEVGFMLTRDVPLLARLFPTLLRVPAIARAQAACSAGDIAGPDELCARAFAAFGKLLSALGETRLLVLFIDDLQWADADSFRMLESVLPAVREVPMLFIAAVRSDTPDEQLLDGTTRRRWATILRGDVYVPFWALDAPPMDQLLGHLEVIDLELGGLSQEETRELVRAAADAAGIELGPRAISVARESGGHPLFALELVHRFLGTDDEPPPSSLSLEDVIWSRVCRLEPHARRLLELIAVGGAPLARSIILRASGLTPELAHGALAQLQAEHLVQTRGVHGIELVEPYHDRIRETVARHLPGIAQRSHHAKLAAAVEASEHGTPRLLVHHLGGAGDRERAAVHARKAAEAAVEALAFEQAAEYYGLACSLASMPPRELAGMRLTMARCLRDAGRGTEAAEVFLQVADQAEPAVRMECRSEAAMQLLMSGNIPAGLRVLAAVLEELGSPATPRAALRRLVWQRGALRMRGLRYRARAACEIPPQVLMEIDMHRNLGHVLGFVDHVLGAQYHTRGLLLALRAGEPGRIGSGLVTEAVYAAARGKRGMARCRELLRAAEACLAQADDPYLEIILRGAEGFVRYFEGAYREAAELFAEVEETYRKRAFAGKRFGVYNGRLFRLIALRHVGDLREVVRLTDGWLRDAVARDDRYMETSLTRALNVRWLIEDRPDEASERLRLVKWPPPDGSYHVQHYYELVAELEIGIYRGDASAAADACRERLSAYRSSHLPRVVACRAMMTWLEARLELAGAARNGKKLDARRGERLARRLDREGLGSTRAWSLLVRGALAHLRGDAMQALELLGAAEAHSEAQGMAGYAQVARMRRGQIMGGEAGVALTADAHGWLRRQGVVSPERYADLYAPGFADQ